MYLCIIKQQSNNARLKKTRIMVTFSNISKETKAEIAIKMVVFDAIEKGHTSADQLCEYMKSEVFMNAVRNYINLMK